MMQVLLNTRNEQIGLQNTLRIRQTRIHLPIRVYSDLSELQKQQAGLQLNCSEYLQGGQHPPSLISKSVQTLWNYINQRNSQKQVLYSWTSHQSVNQITLITWHPLIVRKNKTYGNAAATACPQILIAATALDGSNCCRLEHVSQSFEKQEGL